MKETAVANRPPLYVVIAGGGTGGHIFPGIALAEAFHELNPASRILFAGTGNRLETDALGQTPFEHRAISAAGLKGGSPSRWAIALIKGVMGLLESIRLLKTFKPDLVLGVGGYVSGPMVLAGRLCGVTCVLHEQNVTPGLANRMLAPLVRRMYVTFPDTRGRGARFRKKMTVTGNPVRKKLVEMAREKHSGNAGLNVSQGRFTVLVFGGSQGARRINRAVIGALEHLPLERFYFIHQTGFDDLASVRTAYETRGAAGRIEPFFSDMGSQYLSADLVICRAGATTAAEVTVLGKAAIFVPYPFAADDHQRHNAQSLADAGAAEMILENALSGRLLAERILFYQRHPATLAAMAHTAKTFGKPDAARRIVEDCYELLEKRVAG